MQLRPQTPRIQVWQKDQQTLRWIPIKTCMHTAESNSVIHKDNTIGREGDNVKKVHFRITVP